MCFKAFNQDSLKLMKTLESESIDIICIDPPYKYLKNQKLETDFNELEFFTEAKRLLTKDGFIIMFGRGTSFYRMNCILDDLGFIFKEEIIWDKGYTSSPMGALSRTHEIVVIFGLGKAKIRESRIPYTEQKHLNFEGILQDIKRIKSAVNNPDSLKHLENYVNLGKVSYSENKRQGSGVTITGALFEQDRGVKTLQAITTGLKEKSIIKLNREHYGTIHPTQKPPRLIERLLALCLPNKPKKEIVVADFFGGSFSTAEAVYNLGCNSIICEMDKEYFDLGNQRINKLLRSNKNNQIQLFNN